MGWDGFTTAEMGRRAENQNMAEWRKHNVNSQAPRAQSRRLVHSRREGAGGTFRFNRKSSSILWDGGIRRT